MFFRRQFHGRVQIDHQLQLQAVIQRRQREIPAAGFIIHHFDIDVLFVLPHVHPVNTPFQSHLFLFGKSHADRIQLLQHRKGNFELFRHKAPLFQLILHGCHRSL